MATLDSYTPRAVQPPDLPAKIRLALCQLHVTADKMENIAAAKTQLEQAAAKGAQLVVLPEIWNSPYSNDSFPSYAEDIDAGESPSVAMLQEAAKRLRITLVGGSVPERSAGKLYNTCPIIGPDGTILAKHRKVHLFDIDIPGKITFKESLTLSPGEQGTVVDTPAGRLGVGICYDLRFPELAAVYAQRGVHLIVYPGAFNTVTGPLHWELLQKARAVDNQVFVATCSPARNPASGYEAWGHSTAVGPYGEILATTDHMPGIVYADLDYLEIQTRRVNMPLSAQRRYDLYAIVDKKAPPE